MTRILFVCHGNICRSPMAEFVMKDLVEKAGRSDDFFIESAAVSARSWAIPSTHPHAGSWLSTAFPPPARLPDR